jgi:hypothetical protein
MKQSIPVGGTSFGQLENETKVLMFLKSEHNHIYKRAELFLQKNPRTDG